MIKEDKLYTEAKLNPEMTSKNLGNLASDNGGHMQSTNIKTPKNQHAKSGLKNDYFYDSHHKSKTAVGMNDLSHMSP